MRRWLLWALLPLELCLPLFVLGCSASPEYACVQSEGGLAGPPAQAVVRQLEFCFDLQPRWKYLASEVPQVFQKQLRDQAEGLRISHVSKNAQISTGLVFIPKVFWVGHTPVPGQPEKSLHWLFSTITVRDAATQQQVWFGRFETYGVVKRNPKSAAYLSPDIQVKVAAFHIAGAIVSMVRHGRLVDPPPNAAPDHLDRAKGLRWEAYHHLAQGRAAKRTKDLTAAREHLSHAAEAFQLALKAAPDVSEPKEVTGQALAGASCAQALRLEAACADPGATGPASSAGKQDLSESIRLCREAHRVACLFRPEALERKAALAVAEEQALAKFWLAQYLVDRNPINMTPEARKLFGEARDLLKQLGDGFAADRATCELYLEKDPGN